MNVEPMPSARSFPARFSAEEAYHLGRGTWPIRAVTSARVELPPGLDAPGRARGAIEDHLDGHLTLQEAQDLRLLVTEVVTNAVVHGAQVQGPVLHLAVSKRCVRVEVCDRGSGFELPPLAPREALGAGGYGLMFVDRLTTRWGISGNDGTCVWFEVDRDA